MIIAKELVMKSNRLIKLSYFLVILFLLPVACTNSDFSGYEKDSNGLNYKTYKLNKDADKPEIGDFLTLELVYSNSKDSILFNSIDMKDGFRIPCQEPGYPGDFFYAIKNLHLDDSMAFVISADSFFLKTVGTPVLPDFVDPGDFLFFEAKLTNIQPKAEFEQEQKILMEKQQAMLFELKQKEIDDLNAYIENNNIGLEPTESGLYYIEISRGKGKSVEYGSKVKVHYSGVFLNGQKFDSSYDRDEAVEFEIGDQSIIPGWNEGVKMMREGGKAVIIIPSDIAYGEQGRGDVPPYTTMVFEIELLEVK